MRHSLALALLVTFSATLLLAGRAATIAAPADEYFGPFKQSILEIRNRLNRLDVYGDRSALDPRVVSGLDTLHRAIADWQQKYPRDPWLPRYMHHLLHEYWRAGAVASPGARETLDVMRRAYPGAPDTWGALRELGIRR
jgi:hypothetical protein